MGFFYTGYTESCDPKQNLFKIGETVQDYHIRCKQQQIYPLFALELENENSAQRLFVEAYVRLKMSENYSNVKKDYFNYFVDVNNEHQQAKKIAKKAIYFAKEACQMIKIKYQEW